MAADLPTTRARRLADRILILVFLLATTVPGALHLVTPDDTETVLRENRVPAPFPGLPRDLGDLAQFPSRFAAYYDDTFRGRTPLVVAHNRIKYAGLGTPPTETFVVGDDGWIYCTRDQVLEQHRGLLAFTDEELEQASRVLRRRAELAESFGARYLLAIAPNKHSVYPEHLPAWLREGLGPRPLDQMIEALGGDSPLLDLRPAMAASKAEELSYYRLGTHWNAYGAWRGYRTVLDRLAQAEPRLALPPREAFDIAPTRGVGDNMLLLLHFDSGMDQDFFDVDLREPIALDVRPAPFNSAVRADAFHPDPTLPTLLVSTDSFGEEFLPFLRPHFSRVIECKSGGLDPDLIEATRPDFVLQLLVERSLRDFTLRTSDFEQLHLDADHHPAEDDPARVRAEAVGTYVNPVFGTISVTETDGVLMARQGELVFPLAPQVSGGRRSFTEASPTPTKTFTFHPAAAGLQSRLVLIETRTLARLAFVEETEGPGAGDLAPILGTYTSPGSSWHLTSQGGPPTLFTVEGLYVGELAPAPDREDTYRIRGELPDSEVQVVRTADGEADLVLRLHGRAEIRARRD